MKRPLILERAIIREKDGDKIFEYSYSQDMNVLKKEKNKLFIDLDKKTLELATITKVAREADDAECDVREMYSKTESTRERDDEECQLLELQSKTFTDRERDDEDDFTFN